MKKPELTKEQFFKDFENRFSRQPLDLELVNLEAGQKVFEVLKLEPYYETNRVWGLLVFCKDRLFFISPSSQSVMAAVISAANSEDAPPEQILDFGILDSLKLAERKRHWYDFLVGGYKYTLEMQFEYSGETFSFWLNTRKPAAEIKEKLKAFGY